MSNDLQTTCPVCGAVGNVPAQFIGKQIRCKNCNTLFNADENTSQTLAGLGRRQSAVQSMYNPVGRRYHSLRIISMLCYGVGTLKLGLGLGIFVFALAIFCVTMLSRMVDPERPVRTIEVAGAFSPLLLLCMSFGLLLSSLIWMGFGALLRLMMNVEENTRATAQYLSRIQLPS